MAGRRPKARTLKLVKGNPGKRKLREDEPEAIPGWPEKPPLSKVASAEWDRLATLLENEHRLSVSDGPSLTLAAEAYAAAATLKTMQHRCRAQADLWAKLDARIQQRQEQYRKVINDLCLSQGTRARAKTIGEKPKTGLRAFLGGSGA